MEIVLFQIRTRADIDAQAYERAFVEMVELVSQLPGFISVEAFAGEDGSELALARFESEDAIAAWREHPDHVLTQHRGRTEFFASYAITVATVSRHYDWSLERDGETAPRREPPLEG